MRLEEIQKITESVISFMKTEVLPNLKDTEIYDYTCFTQVWGSTALGFNGWGGDMMTPAITTVVEVFYFNEEEKKYWSRWYVFFGRRFAYFVDGDNEAFKEDKAKGCLVDCDTARTKYNSTIELEENKEE